MQDASLSLLQVSWRFKLLIPHTNMHLTDWSFCSVLTTHVCCFHGKDDEPPGTKPQSFFKLVHPHSFLNVWIIYPECQWSLCCADLCWQMLPALKSSTPNSFCSTDKLVYEFLMHLSCSMEVPWHLRQWKTSNLSKVSLLCSALGWASKCQI